MLLTMTEGQILKKTFKKMSDLNNVEDETELIITISSSSSILCRGL